MVGRTISHYKILEKLGAGGMGTVYKARDTKLDRFVALKFLPPHLSQDEENKKRFIHEAKASSALNHPNIATIYEVDDVDGQMFIAMEYIEGRPLNEIPGATLSKVLEYAVQVAEGLAKAHAKGIIHRDIKPANILVTEDDVVKIVDFGLAKLAGRTMFTKEGTTLGTVAYMSPEQTRGTEVDHRADIWALGVVLYEMATGQLPFKGEYEQGIIYSILNENPEPVAELRPELSEDFDQVVRIALQKEADKRYQDIDEMLVDLKRLTPGGAAKKSGSQKFFSKRHRIVVTVALLSIFVIALWSFFPFRSSSPPPKITGSRTAVAVLPFSVRGGKGFEYLGKGIVDLLSTKLDGVVGWRSVDPRGILGFVDRLEQRTIDPESGNHIAQELDARFYVLGNILEIGGRLQLHASLYDRERGLDAVADASGAGEAAQLFGLVDEVAAQLLVGQSKGQGARIDRIEAVTTSSLPALKAYLEGENAFRKGEFQPAVDAFQRAIAADSSFALAYYRLSIAAEWRTLSELSFEAAEQALRLADRLSKRDRRLLEAFLAYREGRAAQAEQLYRIHLDAYPDDVEALFQLAEVLFHYNPLHGRSFVESQEVFEHVLYYEPEDATSLVHLVRIAAHQKQLEEMNHYLERTLALIPTGDREVELRALRAAAMDSMPAIDEHVSWLATAGDIPLSEAVWSVVVYTQNLKTTELLTSLLTSPTRTAEARTLGHSVRACVHLANGKWELAKKELDAIDSFDPGSALEIRALLSSLPFLDIPAAELERLRQRLQAFKPQIKHAIRASVFFNVHDDIHSIIQTYLLGLLSARLGDLDAAEQYATQLARLQAPPSGGTIATDLALGVQAQIDLGNRQLEQALARLEQIRHEIWYHKTLASPFYAETYEQFVRAEILRELGREKEALAWYENLPLINPFGVVYLAISNLRCGEIYDRLGQAEQAAVHYSRCIDLWRDCDSGSRPLLEEAENRIARLTNARR